MTRTAGTGKSSWGEHRKASLGKAIGLSNGAVIGGPWGPWPFFSF